MAFFVVRCFEIWLIGGVRWCHSWQKAVEAAGWVKWPHVDDLYSDLSVKVVWIEWSVVCWMCSVYSSTGLGPQWHCEVGYVKRTKHPFSANSIIDIFYRIWLF